MRLLGLARRKHTGRGTPEYRAWMKMRERCHRASGKDYPDYGGRGITVCERWGSFSLFLEDMGERPSPQHSLDRIDVNGNYEPGNCRWATSREQAQNKRATVRLRHPVTGEEFCQTEWARRLGLVQSTLSRRLSSGWPLAQALTPKEGR